MHIEGSLSPTLLFELSARNAIALPSASLDIAYASIASLEARYKTFTSLDDFLDYYNRASAVLIDRQDFQSLAYAYMKRAHEDGIQHTEIFYDQQTHVDRGIAPEVVVQGLSDGLKQGEAEFGITFRLIMCILRHLPVESAVDHVALATPFLKEGLIHGLGMCSTEKDQPPLKFQPAYAAAREAGFERFTAHAGEEGPPSYVTSAMEDLGVTRIDHGIRSAEDDEVLKMLSQKGTLLTVCPLSNVCLRVVGHVREIPLRKFMAAGVKFSINSDDPAYFGGYLLDNYVAVQSAFSFTRSEWQLICTNAIEESWISDARKAELKGKLEEVVQRFVDLP